VEAVGSEGTVVMPVAIITGASKGLGRALAEALAARGWDLVLDARTAQVLRETAAGLEGYGTRVRAVPGDVTDAGHRAELVAAAWRLGGVDLLVHNASALGAEPLVRLDALPLEGLRRALEVNLVAALGLVQEALPLLRASGAGTVITVSSDAAAEAYETWGGYGASKAALDQLAAVLGEEEPGLRVWAVDPGGHGDGPVRGGRTGRRRSAAGAGRCGAGVPAAAGRAAGERPLRGARPAGGTAVTLAVRVPEELSARVPVEQRGPGLDRDAVRLLVSRGSEVAHHTFVELPRLLRAGDLLVVNTSPTLAAAVDGRIGHARVVVHFSTRGDDGRWAVELRDPDGRGTTRARAGAAGAEVRLPGGVRLLLVEPLSPGSGRLWWARVSPGGVVGLLREHGRPIRYSYTERDQPLAVYQTVFALPSADGAGSAEMPSAARPFTPRLVAELVSRGVQFAPITLHTGVASAEVHEPPYPERFAVPEASARLINAVRAGGGTVVAVGTTAVRAVESAAGADGVVRAREGWTDLVVTPQRGVRVVDGLLTGLHEPEASHLLMLEAVAGRAAIDRAYEEALGGLYLWHEFGDTHLILPAEGPHTEHC
jgi:S-adenosylmethionine:tRNA ribosyltransferase-isomerase